MNSGDLEIFVPVLKIIGESQRMLIMVKATEMISGNLVSPSLENFS